MENRRVRERRVRAPPPMDPWRGRSRRREGGLAAVSASRARAAASAVRSEVNSCYPIVRKPAKALVGLGRHALSSHRASEAAAAAPRAKSERGGHREAGRRLRRSRGEVPRERRTYRTHRESGSGVTRPSPVVHGARAARREAARAQFCETEGVPRTCFSLRTVKRLGRGEKETQNENVCRETGLINRRFRFR